MLRKIKVNSELQMFDKLTLKIEDKFVSKKVEDWIKNNPQDLYNQLYERPFKFRLARVCYLTLKEKLNK